MRDPASEMTPSDLSDFRGKIIGRSDDLLRRKRFAEARRALLPLIAMALDDADAHLRIGAMLMRQKRFADSAAALDRAFNLAPSWAIARLHYARALGAIGQHADALRHFSALLALRPDRDQGHWGRGEALLALDRVEEAVVSCGRACELAPISPDAAFWLGCAEARRPQPRAAISAFERALQLKPDSGATTCQLGLQYLQIGRIEDATKAFTRLRALAPRNAEGHFHWGMAMANQGRVDDSVHALTRACTLRPAWPLPRLELWRNLVKMRRFPEALSLVRSAGDPRVAMALDNRDAFYTLDQTVRRAFDLGGAPRALEQASALVDGLSAHAPFQSALDSSASGQLQAVATTAPPSPLDATATAILAGDWRRAFAHNAEWLVGGPYPLPDKYAESVSDGLHQGHPLWHLLSPFYHAWFNARTKDSGQTAQHRWAAETNTFDAGKPVSELLTGISMMINDHSPLIEALAPRLAGARVLDIGCGRGEWLYVLGRDLGVPIEHLFGCDLHEGRVNSARDLLRHLSLSRGAPIDPSDDPLMRNLFAANLTALTPAELSRRCGHIDVAFLSRITPVFDDAHLDGVIDLLRAASVATIAEVSPVERWGYSYGRRNLATSFARHGYHAKVQGWLAEQPTPEVLLHLALPRKYWVSTRYYIFERTADPYCRSGGSTVS